MEDLCDIEYAALEDLLLNTNPNSRGHPHHDHHALMVDKLASMSADLKLSDHYNQDANDDLISKYQSSLLHNGIFNNNSTGLHHPHQPPSPAPLYQQTATNAPGGIHNAISSKEERDRLIIEQAHQLLGGNVSTTTTGVKTTSGASNTTTATTTSSSNFMLTTIPENPSIESRPVSGQDWCFDPNMPMPGAHHQSYGKNHHPHHHPVTTTSMSSNQFVPISTVESANPSNVTPRHHPHPQRQLASMSSEEDRRDTTAITTQPGMPPATGVPPSSSSMMLWKKVQHCVVFGGSFITSQKERNAKANRANASGTGTNNPNNTSNDNSGQHF